MYNESRAISTTGGMAMQGNLIEAIEASDGQAALKELDKGISEGAIPREIHVSLFPAVQRVLNPPFINPHLPKMYRICDQFLPHLNTDEVLPLVRLEVSEYAQRPKLEKLSKPGDLGFPASWDDLRSAIRRRDREKAAALMAGLSAEEGGPAFSRDLLLLGSGYLDHSLGHSVSCTAFILDGMLHRTDQDPWPVLDTLADYFCKGEFHSALPLGSSQGLPSDREIEDHLLRATSGRGILNLHHTITYYATEHVRALFSPGEYEGMVRAWISFMGEKETEEIAVDRPAIVPDGYDRFYERFSTLDAASVTAIASEMIGSEQGRKRLINYLIRGVCDLYQGDYNPHYLTGLGSALWVAEHFRHSASLVSNALYQYLDFFFDGIRS
jgi:hypothetical protein